MAASLHNLRSEFNWIFCCGTFCFGLDFQTKRWRVGLKESILLMVASVLLSMVAFSTILWLVKILQQPIRIFAMAVDRAAMENKTEATMRKSIKNWIRNRCHKWVYILFGVTYRKNKQCIAWLSIFVLIVHLQSNFGCNLAELGCYWTLRV